MTGCKKNRPLNEKISYAAMKKAADAWRAEGSITEKRYRELVRSLETCFQFACSDYLTERTSAVCGKEA